MWAAWETSQDGATWRHYGTIEVDRDYTMFSLLLIDIGPNRAGYPDNADTRTLKALYLGCTTSQAWASLDDLRALVERQDVDIPQLREIVDSAPRAPFVRLLYCMD